MVFDELKTQREIFAEAFRPFIELLEDLWDEVKKVIDSLNDYVEDLLTFEVKPKLRPVKKINPNKTIMLSRRMGVYRCRNCC